MTGTKLTASVLKTLSIVLLVCANLFIAVAYSTTPAGTIIKNQASASYKDSNGVLHVTTSNVVESLIQQVAALLLTQNQSRLVAAGKQVFLPHSITNTGNGPDSYAVTLTNNSGDNFDLNGLAIYADDNQDGQPDIYTPLTQSPVIAMQQTWNFVVAGSVPPGALSGQSATVAVAAESQFNTSITAANIDTITVTDDAVLELTKSISATAGASPDGPFTVTLNYRNTGNGDASQFTIIDALPAGMTYVPGSGRWNETGSLVLTDSGAADLQGSPQTIAYCAYDSSCSGLPEANADADSSSNNQITGVISDVASGDTGQVSFQVQITGGLNADKLLNTAEFEYDDGAGTSTRFVSNTVSFEILHNTDVVLNGSPINSADGTAEPNIVTAISQGNPVYFDNIVWNTGNGTDVFDITINQSAASFPAGTIYRVLQADGMTPLMDSSGNGIPDTGPLPVAAAYKVVIQVIPPSTLTGNNGGAGFEVSTMATAVTDSSKANTMLNRLLDVTTASVDITNVAALGDVAAIGDGAGPEPVPVSTIGVAPGTTSTIDLFVNNTGLTAISPDLAVSTTADFSVIEIPVDWNVSFRIDGETDLVTNTGVINPGEFLLIHADVSVPAGASDGDTSLYFRALSEVTGAVDVKHDVVAVATVEQLLLELDQSGQTSPGGSYSYSHILTNNGNVDIASIALVTSNTLGAEGWTSIVYEDTDGDDQLGGADQVITSISNLPAGDIRRLFVKVFSPSDAAVLSINQTVFSAVWNGGTSSVAVTNSTTVAEMEITIVKEQAPDYGCDGTIDSAYGVGGFAVEPGNNCVSYRLTATNAGNATAYNIEVADATPAFTEYFGTASCSHAACTVSEPAAGGQGNVVASLASLAAGAVLRLEFSVRVE